MRRLFGVVEVQLIALVVFIAVVNIPTVAIAQQDEASNTPPDAVEVAVPKAGHAQSMPVWNETAVPANETAVPANETAEPAIPQDGDTSKPAEAPAVAEAAVEPTEKPVATPAAEPAAQAPAPTPQAQPESPPAPAADADEPESIYEDVLDTISGGGILGIVTIIIGWSYRRSCLGTEVLVEDSPQNGKRWQRIEPIIEKEGERTVAAVIHAAIWLVLTFVCLIIMQC